MSYPIGETHDPQLRSWVESANDRQSDFPIQNLPLGIFRNERSDEGPSICAAIGNCILDLRRARTSSPFQLLSPTIRDALSSKTLNAFMELGPSGWSELRLLVSLVRRADHPDWKYQ